MGLFDLLSDAKDNMDKNKLAREYRKRAKELVREGNEIYEQAYNKVTSYATETEHKLCQHTDYKKSIAKELGSTISSTLSEFKQFNIDAKTISAPSFQETNSGLSNFKSAISEIVSRPTYDIQGILDMFISDGDYYEAKMQRDEARMYKDNMKMERTKFNNYRQQMSEIRSFIIAEKNELDSLMDKLKKMTSELKKGIQKSKFTIEEAKYLKGIDKIAQHIVTLLSTEFLKDTFSINQRYQQIFSNIKNINQNLPSAPSITDSNTATAIINILDGTIHC